MYNTNIDTVAEAVRYCRTQALLKGRPGKKISARRNFNVDHSETLESALDDIKDYLTHSYKLGDNPLPFLRKWFKYWEWKRIEVRPSTDCSRVIETVLNNDYTFGFSEASKKVLIAAGRIESSRTSRRMLILPGVWHDEWVRDQLEATGCLIMDGHVLGKSY